MRDRTLAIIGAGLAGFATGCYAQINGYQSHIFEHHSAPGGVAATWKRKDYTVDGGIHFIMGHKPGTALHNLYCELGVIPANRFVDISTYGRFIDEPSGRNILITKDLNHLADELKVLSPTDSPVIDDLVRGARAMQGLDMSQMGMSQPPELYRRLDQIRTMWSMRRVFKYMIGRRSQQVTFYAGTIHDPWVRYIVENLFMPDVPAWFLFMFLGLLADGQLGLLEGGCHTFVQSIEKRYLDLGGQVTYGATVEKVMVENHRAVGVRLAGGTEHRADITVSAADGHSTIFKMLGGRYLDNRTRERFRDWRLIRPMVMVNFGVQREFPDEPWLSIINLEAPFKVGNQPISALMLRIFNYSTAFAPRGKTVVQVSFETNWEWWDNLQKDRPRYDAEKERIAAEILKRLEAHYPGISTLVEMTDVATPYTTWRYTLNHEGAFMGWLPTPQALKTVLPRTLTGLSSFYMAGQWVMPGGGVPPCLYSGRHVVQLICHRDRKSFRTDQRELSLSEP